jgi:hypothetical protein
MVLAELRPKHYQEGKIYQWEYIMAKLAEGKLATGKLALGKLAWA